MTRPQVSDFYTGHLRVTPSRAGVPPADWFGNATSGKSAAAEMRAAGATVAERVEAQFVLSRRGFADAYTNERQGVPLGVPGSATDPHKVVTVGVLVGIMGDDPGRAAIERHVVEGRMPRPTSADQAMEILMSRPRMESFLAPGEGSAADSPLTTGSAFYFDVTSVQVDPTASVRNVLHRQAKVVGLFETGVDMLDSFTLVAPASEVRQLLGRSGDETVPNVLVVTAGAAQARDVAARNHWATQGTSDFAQQFVGQMIAVLQGVGWLVSSLLFILPAALIGHGLARQLSSQQRELAVATAIGVPSRTLADALALQVLAMAGWACVIGPLPLGFAVTWRSAAVAATVTAIAVAVGLWVGVRSRARLPLAASLRAG
ncbi:MAG: hypothetical protein LC620_07320 [Halobacteriales archaeon]|nr:hypothetical protein [Halobacteriales archaeon]